MDLAALMSSPVITIAADTPLCQARTLMVQRGIRHLPVIEAGALVGLLTDRRTRCAEPSSVSELAVYEQAARLEHLPVRQVMTPRLVRRPPQTPVHAAAWLLWEGRAESILVVEKGALVGIVTTSDLLKALIGVLEHRWPVTYSQVVVPVDFRAAAMQALRTAVRLAQQHHAGLTLLHVLAPLGRLLAADVEHASGNGLEQIDADRKSEVQRRLTALLEPDAAPRLTYHIVAGEPVAEIVKTAVHVKADLIVMGRRKRRGLQRLLARSVTEAVVRHAPCPVLIVRE